MSIRTTEHRRLNLETNRCRGFTLIELLVIIAIIAAMISLITPAVQSARAAAQKAQAEENVQKLAAAADEFRDEAGTYPTSLRDLAIFRDQKPSRIEVPEDLLATGQKDGYAFFIVPNDGGTTVEAEPTDPGVTGNDSIWMDLGPPVRTVQSRPTPGADEGRQRMFDNIQAKGAEIQARLFQLEPSSVVGVNDFVQSPDTTGEVMAMFDTDGNRRVSVAEIREFDTSRFDPELAQPLGEFIEFVVEEMKLDGVDSRLSDLTSDNSAGPTFDPNFVGGVFVASALTDRFVTDAKVAKQLVAKLKAAKAAEEQGDIRTRDRHLQIYMQKVRDQVHLTITRRNADTLIWITIGAFEIVDP